MGPAFSFTVSLPLPKGAGFPGHVAARTAYAHTLGLAPAVVVIGAVLGLAVDGGLGAGAPAG